MSIFSSPTVTCLRGRCPRCAEGRIFRHWLQIAQQCSHCGLDLSAHDQGDGPAYLTVFIIGGLVTVLASMTEILLTPPYWLHAVLWLPLVVFGSIGFLHYAKAWLLAASFRHQLLGESE